MTQMGWIRRAHGSCIGCSDAYDPAPHNTWRDPMDIKQAAITCLRDKYVDFNGRAGKEEFWWFFLVQIIIMVVASFLGDVVSGLVSLALLLPGLGVGARRLHDIGKSGWLQ